MIDIFDTHAHYDDEAFDEDREQLLWLCLPGNMPEKAGWNMPEIMCRNICVPLRQSVNAKRAETDLVLQKEMPG